MEEQEWVKSGMMSFDRIKATNVWDCTGGKVGVGQGWGWQVRKSMRRLQSNPSARQGWFRPEWEQWSGGYSWIRGWLWIHSISWQIGQERNQDDWRILPELLEKVGVLHLCCDCGRGGVDRKRGSLDVRQHLLDISVELFNRNLGEVVWGSGEGSSLEVEIWQSSPCG